MTKKRISPKTDPALNPPDKPLNNFKHELFARYYLFGETRASARDAYIKAYQLDEMKPNVRTVASTSSSLLLRNPIILKRINYLLENEFGFNPEDVDTQLAFLISQHEDLRVKLGAIKEYNVLKGRITRKLDITFADTSDAALEEQLTIIEAEIKKSNDLQRQASSEREKTIKGLPHLTPEQRDKLQAGELIP